MRFSRLSLHRQLLLAEALARLCWAKLLLGVVPFRWIAPRLGQRMTESPTVITPNERQVAAGITWAVRTAVRYTPIHFVCLPQALATQWMLRRRKLPSTLYLGVQRQERGGMTAHAWVRVGEETLVGGEASATHWPIATFS